MKGRAKVRMLALLLAVLFALPAFFPAALADDYDGRYPELLEDGHLTATSAILIEADSGQVVYEKNADTPMYPASTTKILTIWLALTLGDPDQKITVSQEAVNIAPDESSAKLAAGEEVALIDLCYAAMLPSGNDAANAIAEGLGGTRENFVNLMNSAAYSLGCTNTHFVNANGLHDENHFTTAHDMALLARVAMQNETFREIVSAPSHVMPRDNIYRSRTIENRNNFVAKSSDEKKAGRYYADSTGIKTGTTGAAGNCLVASATRDGIDLIGVVFNATTDASRYTDARRLMDYGFSQFLSTSIQEIYEKNPRVVDIRGFDLADEQVGRLTLNLRRSSGTSGKDLIVMTRGEMEYWVQNFTSLTVTDFTREFRAPITEGEVMGTLTYYPEGDEPVVYDLVASRSIAARENLAPSIDQIVADAESDPNPFPRLTFELVFLYLLLPAAALYLLVHFGRAAIHFVKSKRKMKAVKPTGRYYR
ncbi:MAG: D-alanyl-D-alanine carboxypeptidase [Clostridia bacterium]|nr:D-alanyl-D-alanine carboxypeptidase [Clostridia bacterium]